MNIEAMEQATTQALSAGLRVLQPFMFADTEAAHVSYLLKALNPPHGAVVLDAGCGVGEVARLMRQERPDLSFLLLNISAAQLAECPQDMAKVLGSFDATPLPDASVDVVMFNSALCHADGWLQALNEAHRVLRHDGILFISDMTRMHGESALMYQLVHARAFLPAQVVDVMRRAGFDRGHTLLPQQYAQRLRATFPNKGLYDYAFNGVRPAIFRAQRRSFATECESAFDRHQHIAFQFSGGRDSTAALYLLRPYWARMAVYHLDTGDQFPETRAVVDRVAQDVPIVRILSDVARVREQFGLASDLVPVDNTIPGRMVSGREVKITSRYECCWRSLMQPMHQRMVEDGITLIVRGQRDDEYAKPPLRSGDVDAGFEALYPIQHWTGEQVSAYLKDSGLPLAPFYERGMKRAPECMGCTAWWDEGRPAYLREYHPESYRAYVENMRIVRAEIGRQFAMLEDES